MLRYILGNGTLNNKLPAVDICASASTVHSCFLAVNEVCFDDSERLKQLNTSASFVWAKTRHGNECSSKGKTSQVWDYFTAVDGSPEVQYVK